MRKESNHWNDQFSFWNQYKKQRIRKKKNFDEIFYENKQIIKSGKKWYQNSKQSGNFETIEVYTRFVLLMLYMISPQVYNFIRLWSSKSVKLLCSGISFSFGGIFPTFLLHDILCFDLNVLYMSMVVGKKRSENIPFSSTFHCPKIELKTQRDRLAL